MMRASRYIRQFRRQEEGHASLEFAIMFPIFFVILLSAIELGIMTMRYSLLERSLDLVVREIRLNTGFAPTHDEMKDMICGVTSVVPDCASNLKLEMIQVDPRNWVDPPQVATCSDRSLETQPVSTFEPGMDNELMVLRVCAKFEPLFGSTGFGAALAKDEAGDSAIIAMSAFVQEPR